MRSRISLALALTTCLGAISAGCDGNGGPVLVPDSGPTPIDSGPPPVDGFVPDTVRPSVTETSPEQGASGVAPSTTIVVTFSEEMNETAGTVSVRAGAETREVDLAWSDDSTTLTITPRAALPSEARVTVTLEDDFADVAGNTLALPYVLVFELGDTDPPVVASSDPAQGATDLSARVDALTITFDEQMDNSVGTLALSGGAGTIGTLEWLDGRTLRAPLSGLAYGTTYRIALTGFTDGAGNALDASVYLDEGAIEITTGADEDAPQVADSVPSEGQVNVALRGTPSIVIVFDEPMSTTVGTATLRAGGLETVLSGTWSDGGRRLTMPVAGRLYPDAPHSVVLAGFVDVAGNALDTTTYLGDGALDFDTGADATVPIVVFSYPNEGSAIADHQLARVEIAFDRAMDQEAVETVRVDDGEAPFDANVTWNLAGTRAYVDVSEQMYSGRSYSLDLRAFVDLNGDPVNPDAPYLGNGVLEFQTRRPRGEQCRDELRAGEATSTLPSGGYEWVIAPASVTLVDNGSACHYAGAPSAQISPDALVRYRKTTAAGSAGGRYLHVRAATPSSGDRVTLAVYRDACGEAAEAGDDARVTCQWDRYVWDQYLDVGAGDYYVWTALTGGRLLDEPITVTIEEVDTVPVGESCANPYTADPALPVYTAPSAPGGEHVWTIPANTHGSVDMDDSWPGDSGISCDPDQVQGVDYVIRIDKTSNDSLVSVVPEATASGNEFHVEVLDACDPRLATTRSLLCEARFQASGNQLTAPRRLTFGGPAGPYYLWVAQDMQRTDLQPSRIRVQEFADTTGSSCANAIRIEPNVTTPVTPTSPARLDVPSCMQGGNWTSDSRLTDGITWYRLTTTDVATVVHTLQAGTPATAGAIAVVDAASGRELTCGTDAREVPGLALMPAGRDVCIAVRNDSNVGGLQIASFPYAGVMGNATDLGVLPPINETNGNLISMAGDTWLAATPTTLYLGLSSTVITAPRSGGTRAAVLTSQSSALGRAGLSIGEALFSLDDALSGSSGRLYRLVNPAGTWQTTPEPWDATVTWPARMFSAMTFDGTSLLVSNDYSATVPVVIRRFSPTAPADSTSLGNVGGSAQRDIVGLAADETWIYFAGGRQAATDWELGVFRVRRSELTTMTPQRIAPIPLDVSRNSSGAITDVAQAPMAVDSTVAATYLYVRGGDGHVHVIRDPGGTTPIYLGPISPYGRDGDRGMAYDPAGPSIFLFETETRTQGNFVRLD
ncbi:Ig-like domain-containing protein [Sandaracinus amylolyticus]|uniref:Subtilisin-like serine protease n=1 Tax=Sandaracinus amylolyticus TaxID=927083 RepID=A0A0F6W701_9BACT|nr:Ig-like domain-containing protein [Sandaracinus amylolyticus]AKF09106.1 Subtilisin-like serine protease [Sandaracinus amylolyticus]